MAAGSDFKGQGMLATPTDEGASFDCISRFEKLRFYQDDDGTAKNALSDPEETTEKLIVDGPSKPMHVKLGKTKGNVIFLQLITVFLISASPEQKPKSAGRQSWPTRHQNSYPAFSSRREECRGG